MHALHAWHGAHGAWRGIALSELTLGPMPSRADGRSCTTEQMQRYAELKKQIEKRNETMKELMDHTRHLLDSLAMWEAHKRQLDLNQQAISR
jgi:cell division protein FtsB